MMKKLLCFAVFGLPVLIFAVRAQAASAPEPALNLVMVELFTSQGCSSCPAADRILGELAQRPDVLALSLPVDYWDYLGWRDTLARPEHTKRQYSYAKVLKLRGPYTPQVVIDGRIDVVGNDKRAIERAIADRLKQDVAAPPIRFEQDEASITVLLGRGGAQEATVWLVSYLGQTQVQVERGENQGRLLTYNHVVRSMVPIGMWKGAPVKLVLPRRDLPKLAGQSLAVVVQGEGTGPILAAARFPSD